MLFKAVCLFSAVLLSLALAAPSNFYLDPVWVNGPETAIGQRFYHSLVQDSKGDIWTFGGEDSNLDVLENAVWKLEVNNNYTWVNITTSGPAPSARGSYQMWIMDDRIYLFGGESNYYDPVYGDFFSFDTLTLEWTLIGDYGDGFLGELRVGNSSTAPGKRAGAAVWSDSVTKTLYMAHGSGEIDNLGDTWSYNINTNIWTWISGTPVGGSSVKGKIGEASIDFQPQNTWIVQCAKDQNGDVWFWSGLVPEPSFFSTNELWRFTPSTYEWAYMGGDLAAREPIYGTPGEYGPSTWPAPTYGGVLVYSGGGILTYFGGERTVNESITYALDQVWSYNITRGQWAFISGTQEFVPVDPEYGAFQASSPSNSPGSRLEGAVQASPPGNMWLHGGSVISSGTPVTAMFVLPVNLCLTELSPCNELADCTPTSWAAYDCTCKDGYTGNGVGANGCAMIEPPIAQSPQDQPQTKTPSGQASTAAVVQISAAVLGATIVLM